MVDVNLHHTFANVKKAADLLVAFAGRHQTQDL
jgi:hypothetical protein